MYKFKKKKIIKRFIEKILTPGTVVEDSFLEESNNYLLIINERSANNEEDSNVSAEKILSSIEDNDCENSVIKDYFNIKSNYPDMIILIQIGDFYEIFGDDALLVSSILGFVISEKSFDNGKKIKMCGFPKNSLDIYTIRLFRAGLKLVVYSQKDCDLDDGECNVDFLSTIKEKFLGMDNLSNKNSYTNEFNLLLKHRLDD